MSWAEIIAGVLRKSNPAEPLGALLGAAIGRAGQLARALNLIETKDIVTFRQVPHSNEDRTFVRIVLRPITRTAPRGVIQSRYSRLDRLLRQLLPDAIASNAQKDRSLCHSLGAPQIQAVRPSDQGSERLVRTAAPREPHALCPLAAMSWQRPDIGSRVTREGHARFWERLEVKSLRATRQNSPSKHVLQMAAMDTKAAIIAGIRNAAPCMTAKQWPHS